MSPFNWLLEGRVAVVSPWQLWLANSRVVFCLQFGRFKHGYMGVCFSMVAVFDGFKTKPLKETKAFSLFLFLSLSLSLSLFVLWGEASRAKI